MAGFTKNAPTPMKKSRVAIFSTTTTLLKRADSFTPITSSQVMRAVMRTASRLQTMGRPKTTGWSCQAWKATVPSALRDATPDSAAAREAKRAER